MATATATINRTVKSNPARIVVDRGVDNASDRVNELRRFREESTRYYESLGYTEETFMEMVGEEIRACGRENIKQEAFA